MQEVILLIIRTVGVYIAIYIVFRFMGKREIGELSVMDLVVFIMLAEIAVLSIEQVEESFFLMLTPMFILLGIQLLTAYVSIKSNRLRTYLDGKPSIIMREGKIDQGEMKRQRYNLDDLLLQLREKDVIDLREVSLAVLETSGKLSVFKKKDHPPSTIEPIIVDGVIQQQALIDHNLSEDQLLNELKSRGITTHKQILLAQRFDDGSYFLDFKN
ncbi:DUF421 domain-containing protein [Halalkalibacillus halophilus]|uniref:DUF421 domain-containing protein n=1 Tax=Halalkalibacillus halophilus TaxID=392827 RepID=UPI0004067127|nr:DUF421 domain-containing protein [Halalkalibacillus halophilus]